MKSSSCVTELVLVSWGRGREGWEGGQGVGGAATRPRAPLGSAGGRGIGRGGELDLRRIGVPAPHGRDLGGRGGGVQGGQHRLDRSPRGIAVQVNGIPAALQFIADGLPLGVGGGDEQQEDGAKEKGGEGERWATGGMRI